MPTWTLTPAQERLIDGLRGHPSFIPFPHAERAGCVLLLGREQLQGWHVVTSLELIQAAGPRAGKVCHALLTAHGQRDTKAEPVVHLVNGPGTDCGLPAKGRRGTFIRAAATCSKCLGEKPAPELRGADEAEPHELGQVDAFLMGLADIAGATRDLAEAVRAVNGNGDVVQALVNDIAQNVRARLVLLATGSCEA